MTLTRAAFRAEIAASGLLGGDYADDVLVRIAHHSSAIEGNSLTVADTFSLLVDETIPVGGKSMRELYEVANHREAFAHIVRHAASGERLTGAFIREIQAELLDHIRDDRGEWKRTRNAIVGAKVETAPPRDVPWLMEQWAENAQWQAQHLHGAAAVTAIAEAHAEFERIHPFPDGNGRTGRMLLMWQALNAFRVPMIIEVERRGVYLAALNDENTSALADLLVAALRDEVKRARQFEPAQRPIRARGDGAG